MKPKIYIDGQSGTTGLEIYERLGKREDIEILRIPEEKRHDREERRKYINSSDISFLCLPDDGAREAVSLIEKPSVRIIDASTAHRTLNDWVYGFPELNKCQREKIRKGKRVANPGCHATGVISIVSPLVRSGIMPEDYPLNVFSLTGYSGGGKKMIKTYEEGEKDTDYKNKGISSPGIYGLSLKHKHIPEIVKYTGLKTCPVFLPVVDDYYRGMLTTVFLKGDLLKNHPKTGDIFEILTEYYKDENFISVSADPGNTLYANSCSGKMGLKLYVYGNGSDTIVSAAFDNLLKGASGAAVQNMNIMLGFPEETGLT